MSLIGLKDMCDDVLYLIYGYLNREDSLNLTCTSKRFSQYVQQYGFLKDIQINMHTSIPFIIPIISNHCESIKTMTLTGLDDISFIPWTPKKLYVNNCKRLYPLYDMDTEEIYLDRHIEIDRNKFKRLRLVKVI